MMIVVHPLVFYAVVLISDIFWIDAIADVPAAVMT